MASQYDKSELYFMKQIRRLAYAWPARKECIRNARVDRNQYKCAICTNIFGWQEMQADHIEPVIDPVVGYVDIYTYFNRCFAPAENWQALCLACHKAKSNAENAVRRKTKKPESWVKA